MASKSLALVKVVDEEMLGQLILTTVTVFGVLTMLLFSSTLCSRGRPSLKKGPSTQKNAKPPDGKKTPKTPSKVNDKMSQKNPVKAEMSKAGSSPIRNTNATSEASKVSNKLKNSPTKARAKDYQMEATQQSNTEDLQLASTQAGESDCDIKDSVVTSDCKVVPPVKGYLLPFDDSMKEAPTQNSTKQTQTSTKQTQTSTKQTQCSTNETNEDPSLKQASPKHRKEDKNEQKLPKARQSSSNAPPLPRDVNRDKELVSKPPGNAAPPLPRDVNRDKELAMKALVNLRAKRAQNAYSARERKQALETLVKDAEKAAAQTATAGNPKGPEFCDPYQKAQVLTDEEDHLKKSSTVPNNEAADSIPDGEKIDTPVELEKEDEEGDEEEESKPKMITCQAPTYVPEGKRQFRPVSEIPEDDLTIKRKKKKKKKRKKKTKKSSDDDDK